jgi:serine/threonine protein kinase/tetratricopeptide (TPR) repeat protein
MSGGGEPGGLEAGTLLGGRYRLAEILGHGGTGTVWSGLDLGVHREVAIKVLRPELTRDARLRRRLRREARAVARLEHPNIVRLFGIGDLPDGSPYLAMERVHGVPLHHLLARGLPLSRSVAVFEQVLAALAFAHARGVVHRDLKPQNVHVMRGPGGEDVVKLLDFGFARVENDSDDGLTAAVKDVFGTPTYMSPEQATGDHEVGPPADLYAVGVMLWEAVCGAPPFTGATGTAVVVQHVTAPLPPFLPRADLLPPHGLEAVVRQALEKEPVRRHASAAAFRRALLAAFEDGDADDESFTTVNAVTSVTSVMTSSQPPAFERTNTEPGLTTLAEARVIDAPRAPATPVGAGDLGPSRDDLPLVGRESLQRWLWERAVDTCQTGQPHFVLLDGPVGIGKSRLCAWLHQTMAEGGWMWPLKGRHRIGSGDGGLRDVVRAALGLPRQPGTLGRDAVPQALAELDPEGALDPQLLTRWLWPVPERPCPPGSAVRLVEQLARRLSRRRPLYLWLDDVHHADAEAFVIFDHLASNLTARPAPVFVVATRRTDAPASGTPALDAMAAFLKRHHERIELREVPRLDERAIQALAAHAAPLDANAVAFVSGAARGNPLHALELVRYLQDTGTLTPAGILAPQGRGAVPRSPVELVRARLQGALHGRDPELGALAERLSLLGGAFPFAAAETVARRIGLDAVRLDTGLEALVRMGVLADDAAETYAFRHELVREALAEELADRPDAATAHLAVAEALLAVHGERSGEVALAVARHFRMAGDVARAVERQLAGARYARSVGQGTAAVAAHQEAERWLSEVEPTPALQAMLADCWRGLAELALDQNDTDRALRLAERLETWARMVRDHGRAAAALRLRGEAQLASGRWLEAEKLLADARARFETMGDDRVVAQIDLSLGRAALQSSRVEVAQACFARAAGRFAAAGDGAGEAACRRALGELAVRAGDRPTATRLLTEAAAMGEAALDHRLVGQAAWRLGELLRQGGQAEAAVGRYQQAVENCEAVGDLAGLGRALRGLGDTERMLERVTAESSYRRAVEVFESVGDQFQLAICHTQLGRMAAERDDLITAEAAFERALRTLESFDDPVRVGVLHAYLARIADRRGDRVARDHRLQVALRFDAHRPLVVREWPMILEDVAAHLVAEGEPHRARALRERAAQIWTALGRPDDAARCLAGG